MKIVENEQRPRRNLYETKNHIPYSNNTLHSRVVSVMNDSKTVIHSILKHRQMNGRIVIKTLHIEPQTGETSLNSDYNLHDLV